ncbi:MAG: coiled-coil protein [Thermoplasmata archaeon]
MTELFGELQEKRNERNIEAERHKRRRDELNDKTKQWVGKRDELNAKVREQIDKAMDHREERDRLNLEVKKAKEERDKLNRKVNEMMDGINRLKRRHTPRGKIPLSRLKRDLRDLEFRQMTSVMKIEKERELVESVSRLKIEIDKRERQLEKVEEIQKALRDLEETKSEAEECHKSVGELADAAQEAHDKMMALYEKSDVIRRQADAAQEQFIRTKITADEEHKRHISLIREVHDFDKMISGIRRKQRRARVSEGETVAKREAEEIYDRFKRGEKLSTEDLMTLQKSGYI